MSQSDQTISDVRRELQIDGQTYKIFSLSVAAETIGDISKLPKSLKVLLENQLQHQNGAEFRASDAQAIVDWLNHKGKDNAEISFKPARVLMQDFTGVPAVVDLAAMRDAVAALGGDANQVNPVAAVDLVIDHSVMVDEFGTPTAFQANVDREFERNGERYEFLKWGQTAFDNFRVIPPGTGICHQVNLEYLAPVVSEALDEDGNTILFADTVVGTDSHTTMINGVGVLGWGVGGIEAEVSMLGEASSMLVPEVVGVKLTGKISEGTTATDIVLNIVKVLRQKGVVGKFVEFYGEGLDELSLADRATIANMAPEYGATCGFFPIDQEAINYLTLTGRPADQVKKVEAHAKAQGLWRDTNEADPVFTDVLEFNLSSVKATIAGPERPEDAIELTNAGQAFKDLLTKQGHSAEALTGEGVEHGSVVVAAITSCTNTSNPAVMIAAGLIAKNAVEKGLSVPKWVKTSLAPGSQVVTDYLERAGLQQYLDQLRFNTVGYGCTSCIGNSGPLAPEVATEIDQNNLIVASVGSGNRNFPGRVHAATKASYLASPPLVVAYALAGSVNKDLLNEPLGQDQDGNDVFLKDIWPSQADIKASMDAGVDREMFVSCYSNVFEGVEQWQKIDAPSGLTYTWAPNSTYIKHPPYFEGMKMEAEAPQDIVGARALALFPDDITTDHISPAGSFKEDTPAGQYLISNDISAEEFNSYGSRRGNHEVMMRGTYANIRINNAMADGKEGGYTAHIPDGEIMSLYDAAMRYKEEGTPVIVFAGKNLGKGSSRDWAAKGPSLLGVKAAIAESYERIHRSNLVGMGVLPLEFAEGTTAQSLKLDGSESFDIKGIETLKPRGTLTLTIKRNDGSTQDVELLCRVDTAKELEFIQHGGVMHRKVREMASRSKASAAA